MGNMFQVRPDVTSSPYCKMAEDIDPDDLTGGVILLRKIWRDLVRAGNSTQLKNGELTVPNITLSSIFLEGKSPWLLQVLQQILYRQGRFARCCKIDLRNTKILSNPRL